jgi:hypothetical protein
MRRRVMSSWGVRAAPPERHRRARISAAIRAIVDLPQSVIDFGEEAVEVIGGEGAGEGQQTRTPFENPGAKCVNCGR